MVNIEKDIPTKLEFFNKGYVTTDVSSVKSFESNTSKENRIKWITDLAAVSRGQSESKNPEKRFLALTEEAALKTASRPLEFCPVVLDTERIRYLDIEVFDNMTRETLMNRLMRYSYLDNGKVYTNMRALINAGVSIDKIPYNEPEDLKDFKAIKIKLPMFVWSQLMTHTALSKESQSDRVAEETDYYLPDDFYKRLVNFNLTTDHFLNMAGDLAKSLKAKIIDLKNLGDNSNWLIGYLLNNLSQNECFLLFRLLDYKREIWSRAMYYFKYKEMIMTGWSNDPYAWKHLFVERNCVPSIWRNWTQKETMEVVSKIKTVLGM